MTIQEYNDIYKNSITKSMQIESSGGVTITNTNICSEQMSLEEALCSEENLIIGSCESACFKIRIADMNHNFEGETLTVYQMIMVDAGGDLLLESGDSDYILLENGNRISLEMVGVPVPYGKFKVLSDKPTNDRRWRDLTCYDAMYDILNADVAEWYNSLTFPMTIKNFRDRFFNYLGITQDTVTLVNDNFETQGGFAVSGSLSGKDVITSICELNGVFGHISRDGLFEYISLPSADSLALDWYIDGTGAYEDYLVQKITGIVARSSEDDVGTTVGTDTNLYVVEDNPLIYGSEGTASLTTALTNLLNNVKDINYRPFNVDTYGNPMLPLGTNLTITTRNQTINSFLMTRVLSGIQSLKDSISAKGEKYRPTEVNSLRSETKRTKGIIHELINDVDELRSTITDLDNQTSSEIQQLSDEIVLKVDASGNIVKVALASNVSEGSTFAVNADNIRFTAGSVMRFDANNIIINSTYFKVDQYGNLESTSGKIGGWYIRSGGLSNGMTTVTDFANTGIFLSSGGRIVINDANTHTNSRIDKDSYSIIRNDIGANAYVGYISNSVGFGFEDAYGSQVSFKGTALNLGCVKDGTSVISNVRLQADPFSITLYGGDTGYANKIISLIQGFRDNSWTNEKVTYVDTYKGLQTCDTTKTEVEYVHGVTSNIQTQLNGKQATITGGATTIVSNNLTASKALVSNANGKVAVSSVTATELDYLSGATSNIQGQIDSMSRIVHPHIYGVKWDWANSNSPALTRTDMSQYFIPSPTVSNGTGSSPFDLLYPWCEMQVVEDAEAGSLVKIPKFWYKFTVVDNAYTLQIADAPVDGFYVSPAHRDRGDGKGERDVIYVGRYHCDTTYKSQAGSTPIVNITRATARTNIHNLGSTIWQYDYLTMWTIRMLYLVEYASFDSQGMIGYGCSTNGAMMNTGYTDAMQYHTGTDASSRTTYGGTQYRHIEGLWDNVNYFVDGMYYGWSSTYVILNPNNFADGSNGIYLGSKIAAGGASSGYGVISQFSVGSGNGLDGIPCSIGKTANSNFNIYSCDYALGRNYGTILITGGEYTQSKTVGLFLENAWVQADVASATLGCRLMKLP